MGLTGAHYMAFANEGLATEPDCIDCKEHELKILFKRICSDEIYTSSCVNLKSLLFSDVFYILWIEVDPLLSSFSSHLTVSSRG